MNIKNGKTIGERNNMPFIIMSVVLLVIATIVLVGLSLTFSKKSVKKYSLRDIIKNKKN